MSNISIVITSFNSKEFVKSCLDSVFAQDYRDFEAIVVDNGSKDDTVDFIKNNYPDVKLIKNDKNDGACKARNQGIDIAKGEYILTLDNDCILEKDFLSKALKAIEEAEENVGMIQPKILKQDRKTIDSTGIYLSKLRRFYDIGKDQIDNGQFNRQRNVFGACCACALYKKKMLQNIKENTGYFDERFFFLVEDVDLAWRAQRKGWKAIYYPEAICYHRGNSSKTSKKLRQYLCFRNRRLLILKNEKLNIIIKKIPFYLIYDLPRLFYLLITNRHTLRALYEMVKFTPAIMLRKIFYHE